MESWTYVGHHLPPEGKEVETKIDNAQGVRNMARLTRRSRLWFAGDVYVYYTPTHWRYS